MFKTKRHVQIEWGDCDPAGIVFYPRYFAIFDASTAAMFDSLGFPILYIRNEMKDVGFPMVDTRSQFFQPCVYGDKVTVQTEVRSVGHASFEIHHRLIKDDGALAVECTEKRVWTNLNQVGKIQSKAIPTEIREKLLNAN